MQRIIITSFQPVVILIGINAEIGLAHIGVLVIMDFP
jgi:hypothetical protein